LVFQVWIKVGVGEESDFGIFRFNVFDYSRGILKRSHPSLDLVSSGPLNFEGHGQRTHHTAQNSALGECLSEWFLVPNTIPDDDNRGLVVDDGDQSLCIQGLVGCFMSANNVVVVTSSIGRLVDH